VNALHAVANTGNTLGIRFTIPALGDVVITTANLCVSHVRVSASSGETRGT
jgi:hypothetical protein